jgi:outer membrane protein, heavy metal efflux system
MRLTLCIGALVLCAGPVVGQQADTVHVPMPIGAGPECVPASPAADTLCITRREAIARALVANPQLQAAGAQTREARARKVQTVAMPDPAFSVEWDASHGPFGTGGGALSELYQATLTIPFFDKFRLNHHIGRADVSATEADSASVRHQVVASTSQAYDDLLSALRHRGDLQEIDSLAADFVRKTQARFDAGTVARLDVVNAQVALGQAHNDLLANGRDIANARAALNRLLGRPVGAALETADTLAPPPPLPDLAPLVLAAAAHRPELESLRQQQAGAHATTALAREFWLPDFTVGLYKDYAAGPQPGLLLTGFSFPIPLFYWNHSKGEIAQDHWYETELAADYRDAEAAVEQDVRAAYATATTSLQQVVYVRDQLLPAARDAYRIAAASYALGGSSALEVNAARAALADAEGQYTDLLAAANSARADLERAVAVPLATFSSGASQ